MQLVITGEAENDLAHIAEYVGASGSAAAAAFLGDLQSTLYHLVETPEAFPIVSRYRSQAVRKRVFRDYLIFYRVRKDAVTVLRILHGARDYDALLSSDPSA